MLFRHVVVNRMNVNAVVYTFVCFFCFVKHHSVMRRVHSTANISLGVIQIGRIQCLRQDGTWLLDLEEPRHFFHLVSVAFCNHHFSEADAIFLPTLLHKIQQGGMYIKSSVEIVPTKTLQSIVGIPSKHPCSVNLIPNFSWIRLPPSQSLACTCASHPNISSMQRFRNKELVGCLESVHANVARWPASVVAVSLSAAIATRVATVSFWRETRSCISISESCGKILATCVPMAAMISSGINLCCRPLVLRSADSVNFSATP